jgi:hypothetical protein
LFAFTATTVAFFPVFQSVGGITPIGQPPADPPVMTSPALTSSSYWIPPAAWGD